MNSVIKRSIGGLRLVIGISVLAALFAPGVEAQVGSVPPATITCLSPNGGFSIDGMGFYILQQGESMDFVVRPQGSTFVLHSCGWDEGCLGLQLYRPPGIQLADRRAATRSTNCDGGGRL